MSDVRVSFIIPFYNVEKYIGICLDSLYNQDIPEFDFEVICIDDCSPDSSKDIVLEYQKIHSNIILIEHSVNKKVGGARNTGLNFAKGKYVWFIDSDDFIYPNIVKKMILECEMKELDLFCFNIEKVTDQGIFINKEQVFSTIESPLNGIDFLKKTFGSTLIYHLGYPYRALYRRDYLITKKFYFPEQLSYGEETVYLARATAFAQRVASTDESYYLYRQSLTSISVNLIKLKGDIIYQSVIRAASLILKFEEEIFSKDSELAIILHLGVSLFSNRLLVRALKCTVKQRFILFSQLRNQKENTLKLLPYMTTTNRFISSHTIIGFLLITIIAPIYKIYKN
ncbi:MAG: glycosyltransferase family 2 protein [Paludibacter sp.]